MNDMNDINEQDIAQILKAYRSAIVSLECAAQWVEKAGDPRAAAAEIRAALKLLNEAGLDTRIARIPERKQRDAAAPDDSLGGSDDQPDYQAAFRRVCADMGAISALLGVGDYPGIDRILREITELHLKSRTGSIPEGWRPMPEVISPEMIQAALAVVWPALYRDSVYRDGDGPNLKNETMKRVERIIDQYNALMAAAPQPNINAQPDPSSAGNLPKGTAQERLDTALARYDALMASVEGCTDGGCVIRRPAGMHTNGGCRCTRAAHKMQRAMHAAKDLRTAVAALAVQVSAGAVSAGLEDEAILAPFIESGAFHRGVGGAVEGGKVEGSDYREEILSSVARLISVAQQPAGAASDAQAVRAIEIADQSMVELLRSHAVRFDALTPAFGLSTEDGTEVATLEEADPAIQEAFEWLQSRGLAELLEETTGTCILLKGHALEFLNA
ncbi:hypothetical protein [Paraburkholderia humisilvae]|uniref:Uncharacterized protein n=1 Tax=Paraburkholderia humisilvae TaxID=627669 RepID=A0A6J5DL94_9BURK|nr:hypothetical protein [Paraburkholderia humisilvae]CAB3753952.1 hypothetical protein LMG29542_02200 [Paraburkholderia humisilvae]